jgi:hypothetical protein
VLELHAEQLDALHLWERARQSAHTAQVLAQIWPQVHELLGERWAAFVQLALQRAAAYGLSAAEDQARFASLWCLWGAGFEAKPGFEWALEIANRPHVCSALKLHQWAHRTRLSLQERGAAAAVGVDQFNAAWLQVGTLMGCMRSAWIPTAHASAPLAPSAACDLGAVHVRVMECELDAAPTVAHTQRLAWSHAFSHAPAEPLVFNVLSRTANSKAVARLEGAVQTLGMCGDVHPALAYRHGAYRAHWQGRDAQRFGIALPLLETSPAASAWPAWGEVFTPELHQFDLQSCGVRDEGEPFGQLALACQVLPAYQWHLHLRSVAGLEMSWPAPQSLPSFVQKNVQIKAERDGVDMSEQAQCVADQWQGLQLAFQAGFDRFFQAWQAATDEGSARLVLSAAPLNGSFEGRWGYARLDENTVVMRLQMAVDALALGFSLQLLGRISHADAQAELRLGCAGQLAWRERRVVQAGQIMADEQEAGGATPPGARAGQGTAVEPLSKPPSKPLIQAWSWPMSLELNPVVTARSSLSVHSVNPPSAIEPGADATAASGYVLPDVIQGECGLRASATGRGWEWFFQLRLAAAAVTLQTQDPVCGTRQHHLALWPAQVLVDWVGS